MNAWRMSLLLLVAFVTLRRLRMKGRPHYTGVGAIRQGGTAGRQVPATKCRPLHRFVWQFPQDSLALEPSAIEKAIVYVLISQSLSVRVGDPLVDDL